MSAPAFIYAAEQAIDVLARELQTGFLHVAAGTLAGIHHDLDCAERIARKMIDT